MLSYHYHGPPHSIDLFALAPGHLLDRRWTHHSRIPAYGRGIGVIRYRRWKHVSYEVMARWKSQWLQFESDGGVVCCCQSPEIHDAFDLEQFVCLVYLSYSFG